MAAGQSVAGRLTPAVVDRDRAAMRTVVLVSADAALRERLRRTLTGLRWQVREANGGAEAMVHLDAARAEAMLLDSWLPDLEIGEFTGQLQLLYPAMDLVQVDGGVGAGGARSPRRNELLHALRESQAGVNAFAPVANTGPDQRAASEVNKNLSEGFHGLSVPSSVEAALREEARLIKGPRAIVEVRTKQHTGHADGADEVFIAGLVGRSQPMRELARLIRLVAPRSATVLVEGETGTGKEVVAKALHRLSTRCAKAFTVLNCAAIPETLLEAELFGHARGAFTGAVQARTGRIEAADGGTLFLDEIGEMPLALQAKMLRFLESGELQRVGDNELTKVDVRVIAATHQPLEERAEKGLFRLDLYHRLAVFPVEVPALRKRLEDLPVLVEYFLEQMGREMPRKRITAAAFVLLTAHAWPGNVRELMHVLERGAILAEDRPEIGEREIRLRRTTRSASG